MLGWFTGKDSKSKHIDDAAAGVLKAYPGSSRRGDVVDVPIRISGLPEEAWFSVSIPQDYPKACPTVTYNGRCNPPIQHPALEAGGQIKPKCVHTWHTRNKTLKDLVDAVVYDLQVRQPGVQHPGEDAVIIEKAVGESLGCQWSAQCVLQSVHMQARWHSTLSAYVGRECVRVNNAPTGRATDKIVAADGMSYVVLNFRKPTEVFADASAPAVSRERNVGHPPAGNPAADAYSGPPLPSLQSLGDCGLERAAAHDSALLERMSGDPAEVQEYFIALPFTKQCDDAVEAAKVRMKELQRRHDDATDGLVAAKTRLEQVRSQQSELRATRTAVNEKVEQLKEKTSAATLTRLLDEHQRVQENRADSLERQLMQEPLNVSSETWKQYKAARTEFHLAKARKAMLIGA